MLGEDGMNRMPEIDFENKLIAPTLKLYYQIGEQLTILYSDIRRLLIDIHDHAAVMVRRFYDQPLESLNTWSDRLTAIGDDFRARVEYQWLPDAEAFYRHWQARVIAESDAAGASWRRFQDDPERFALDVLTAMANHLDSIADSIEALLINQYYVLSELLSWISSQPATAMQAAYHHALAKLLDIYYDIVSSLLVM